MKKGMIAGLLLLAAVSGCSAGSARQDADRPEESGPAEEFTMNSEQEETKHATEALPGTDSVSQNMPEETESESAGVPGRPEAQDAPGTSAAETDAPGTSAAGTDGASELPASESAEHSGERTVYADGFYYEPISDEVKQRIYGLSYKEDCTVPYEELRYVSVTYVDFEGAARTGELICNKGIAQDLVEIFHELYQAAYPIDKIRLIDEYNADDDLSCLDNNTSCFNYRVVGGSTNLSKHALGLAVDINPFYNPYVTYPDGVERISPPGSEPYADRSLDFPHKIDENDLCYQLFTSHGFTWGGHWKTLKDYQHFQKAL